MVVGLNLKSQKLSLAMNEIKTERLLLRPWREEDLEPFAKMNADLRVMEYFPSVKSYMDSADEMSRIINCFKTNGWGFWAATLLENEQFLGFIGLHQVHFNAHFTPAVEIGWRLSPEHWGKGYAPEGAKASLAYAFQTLGLNEVVAFTAVENKRSRIVMEKIGMHYDANDDFDHPSLAKDHMLCRHVLYRIGRDEWLAKSC